MQSTDQLFFNNRSLQYAKKEQNFKISFLKLSDQNVAEYCSFFPKPDFWAQSNSLIYNANETAFSNVC